MNDQQQSSRKKIGFIGQGWIGKNYADDFEQRGFAVVRYALEEPHVRNGEAIAACDIVFIAVPTPTRPEGFDDSILRTVVKKVGRGKIAIIKSTILPGTTESIQRDNPEIIVLHSPEFLREANAAYDAANPSRNIIGRPVDNEKFCKAAQEVLEVLPSAPFQTICSAREAEFVKYAGNCFLYVKVVYVNMLYDLAAKLGCDWETVKTMFAADPRIGSSHLNPVHASGPSFAEATKGEHSGEKFSGRGAGGHCFIKDFAAFTELYQKLLGDASGLAMLDGIKEKNLDLLIKSGKDPDLVKGVYGENVNPLK